ncbi:MAG: hemerythrin domain-containing protein [Rhodospirillaceae bacterium]|nr:hemerythrin domain-containing protein [Rhodospirillaceae bacterium]
MTANAVRKTTHHASQPANDSHPATAPERERREIYSSVHKGLRSCMSQALVGLGQVDASSDESVDGALAAVTELLQLCREHLDHENRFLHTAMEQAVPGSAARCAADHQHHLKTIAELEARLSAAQADGGPTRERALKVLYRLLAIFVAENFQHMEVEESENTSLLWAHCSDDDIRAIEHAIHAHIKPERMMVWLRWMLPAVSRQQRAEMLKGMRAGMPPEAFAAVLDMIQPHLSQSARHALVEDLG